MTKKRTLTPEQAAECEHLKNIYKVRARSAGINQMDVAEELGITQAAVSHYLNGVNPLNARVAAVFAKLLGMPVRSFSHRLADEIEATTEAARIGQAGLDPESNVRFTPQPNLMYRYPVISWVAAGAWAEAVEPFPPGFSDRYELSEYEAKGPAFWLEVKGDSMTSPIGQSITEGTLILVDTEADAFHGKLVIAKLSDSNEATFKKLVEDGGRKYLRPLNPAYPTEMCAEGCRIVGVVVRALMKL